MNERGGGSNKTPNEDFCGRSGYPTTGHTAPVQIDSAGGWDGKGRGNRKANINFMKERRHHHAREKGKMKDEEEDRPHSFPEGKTQKGRREGRGERKKEGV